MVRADGIPQKLDALPGKKNAEMLVNAQDYPQGFPVSSIV